MCIANHVVLHFMNQLLISLKFGTSSIIGWHSYVGGFLCIIYNTVYGCYWWYWLHFMYQFQYNFFNLV
jgi:hypothetical protein